MTGKVGNGNVPKTNDLRRQLTKARLWAALTVVAGLATVALAWEEATPQGLSGILAPEPPANLSAEAFSVLGGSWADWSAGAAHAVAELYRRSTEDLAAQRQAVAAARAKLNVMEQALRDQKYASIAVPLTGLSSALARRLDVCEAILDTLEMDPQAEHPKRMKAKADAVLAAVDALSKSLESIKGGNAWLPYIKAQDLTAALKENPTGDAAVAAARASKAKLAARASVDNPAQKDFLNRPAFVALEGALDQYLAAAENPPTADHGEKLREQLTALVAGLELYEASGQSSGANQARRAYSAIRKLAADGGDRLTAVLQKHYFNYNVRIVASEELLSRLLADSRTEHGQVVDFILGANVGGWQTTSTNVSVDLKPSRFDARWDIVLSGNVSSNTQGVTSQATIYTQGNHTFRAVKEVRFNGSKFTTLPGTISVNANNTTTGVATQFSGGLFGGIADRIAYREAEARRGQAQAIAASRIQDRVLPRFNQEVDDAFVKAEKDLQTQLFDHLRATNLYPDAMLFQTTDREFRVSTRLMGETELGANQAPAMFTAPVGATLFVHESEMNNGADRIGLAGKSMTDDELRAHLEQFFSKALNREFKIERPAEPAPEPGEDEAEKKINTFVFAPSDPIRIRLQDGTLSLILRSGFKREGGDDIPQQIITVPLSFQVKGDQIQISRGLVRVESAEAGGAGQIATAGVIRRKIQNTLPERTVSGKFTLKGTRRDIQAVVSNIRIVDGWAIVSVK
jgi:hypothetical protein